MRVVVADGNADARAALKFVLKQEPSIEVVAEAGETRGLLANIVATQPDLVIVDWNLPGHPVADLLDALHHGGKEPCVVVVGFRQDDERAAMAAGADGFVNKLDPPSRFIDALEGWLESRSESGELHEAA